MLDCVDLSHSPLQPLSFCASPRRLRATMSEIHFRLLSGRGSLSTIVVRGPVIGTVALTRYSPSTSLGLTCKRA